jgi:hypothetical protein
MATALRAARDEVRRSEIILRATRPYDNWRRVALFRVISRARLSSRRLRAANGDGQIGHKPNDDECSSRRRMRSRVRSLDSHNM